MFSPVTVTLNEMEKTDKPMQNEQNPQGGNGVECLSQPFLNVLAPFLSQRRIQNRLRLYSETQSHITPPKDAGWSLRLSL